jgi:glutathionylspermidine synthase
MAVRTRRVEPIPASIFEQVGFYWYDPTGDLDYVADELVLVTAEEGEALYRAAEELYGLYVRAAQHVIDENLFPLLDIPDNLVAMIRTSWEDDRHFHLLGRFDLAGGLDGKPVKLIEFNADTPSMIFETALVQWMLLRHNGLEEERQFNRLYETLQESFQRIRAFHPAFSGTDSPLPCILFSCLDMGLEDENTTRLLEEMAYEAGFITGFEYVHDVQFDEDGVYNAAGDPFDFWYKLVPYEYIGAEEPELAALLTDLLRRDRVILLNPPYTLLFQSKGILKILWDLFPGHPLLLETAFEPLRGRPYVEKKTFSREGDNVRILDAAGNELDRRDGDYVEYRSVFQEFAELPADGGGCLYQAGVFFSWEPCGLGFRREKGIIHNHSQFAGHMVADE